MVDDTLSGYDTWFSYSEPMPTQSSHKDIQTKQEMLKDNAMMEMLHTFCWWYWDKMQM